MLYARILDDGRVQSFHANCDGIEQEKRHMETYWGSDTLVEKLFTEIHKDEDIDCIEGLKKPYFVYRGEGKWEYNAKRK